MSFFYQFLSLKFQKCKNIATMQQYGSSSKQHNKQHTPGKVEDKRELGPNTWLLSHQKSGLFTF
jgi:hypothetical protein